MKKFAILFAAAILILTAISAFAGDGTKDSPLKIGVTEGPHAEILEFLQPLAEKEGVFYKLLVFDNHNIPNEALNAGDLDANAFQHRPFLDAQIKAHGYKIVPIHDNILCPIGLFSKKVKNLSDLQEGASIAIPNDPSNGGRSLLLLQKLGLVVNNAGSSLVYRCAYLRDRRHCHVIMKIQADLVAIHSNRRLLVTGGFHIHIQLDFTFARNSLVHTQFNLIFV